MTEDHQATKAKLKAWFQNSYHRESFRCSMGEVKLSTAGMKAMLGFLAQGVALWAINDPIYTTQLISAHEKLKAMNLELELIADGKKDPAYHFSMICGSMIELAVEAMKHLIEDED